MAAGSGSRLGSSAPKAFVKIGGRSLLSYAVERVRAVAGLRSLVLVVPEGYLAPDVLAAAGIELAAGMSVVPGGAERTESVAAGVARIDPACDVILVHDAARCCTPVAVFDRVVAAVRAGAAGAVPGLPVVDTIKTVSDAGVITGTPDRSTLRAIQTPQGFRAQVLREAYASGLSGTDDAALVEATGHEVVVVDGDPLAFKVTLPEDLARAERVLASVASDSVIEGSSA